ncbi:MAG: hypothetical protein LC808_01215 [Actinobacteria bacterium]|nr:hypothetical protein [Actinomycetota bacterium]
MRDSLLFIDEIHTLVGLTEFRHVITVGLSVLPAPRPSSPSVENCWNSAGTTISKGWSTAHELLRRMPIANCPR